MVKIFIVEDDESIRRLYKMALELNGHEIIGMAGDGIDAVIQFKDFHKKPDVIIMDHRMPLKSGLEATKEILKMDGNCRIILATADKSIRDEALSLGVKSFKEKPIPLQKLLENIEKHAFN